MRLDDIGNFCTRLRSPTAQRSRVASITDFRYRMRSTIPFGRLLESNAETQRQLQPPLLRLSAMISQQFVMDPATVKRNSAL